MQLSSDRMVGRVLRRSNGVGPSPRPTTTADIARRDLREGPLVSVCSNGRSSRWSTTAMLMAYRRVDQQYESTTGVRSAFFFPFPHDGSAHGPRLHLELYRTRRISSTACSTTTRARWQHGALEDSMQRQPGPEVKIVDLTSPPMPPHEGDQRTVSPQCDLGESTTVIGHRAGAAWAIDSPALSSTPRSRHPDFRRGTAHSRADTRCVRPGPYGVRWVVPQFPARRSDSAAGDGVVALGRVTAIPFLRGPVNASLDRTVP